MPFSTGLDDSFGASEHEYDPFAITSPYRQNPEPSWADLENEYTRLRKENFNLKLRLLSLEEQLQACNEGLDPQLPEVLLQLSELRADKAALLKEKSRTTALLEDKMREVKRHQATIDELEAQLTALAAQGLDTKASYASKISLLEDEVAIKAREAISLKTANDDLRRRISQLEEDNQELKHLMDINKREDKAQLTDRCNMLEEQLLACKREVDELHKDQSRAEDTHTKQIKGYQAKVEEALAAKRLVEKRLKEYEEEMGKARAENMQFGKQYEAELLHRESSMLIELQSLRDKAEDEIGDTDRKWKSQLEALRSEATTLRESLDLSSKREKRKDALIKEYQEALTAVEEERDKLSTRADELEVVIAHQLEQIQERDEALEELEAEREREVEEHLRELRGLTSGILDEVPEATQEGGVMDLSASGHDVLSDIERMHRRREDRKYSAFEEAEVEEAEEEEGEEGEERYEEGEEEPEGEAEAEEAAVDLLRAAAASEVPPPTSPLIHAALSAVATPLTPPPLSFSAIMSAPPTPPPMPPPSPPFQPPSLTPEDTPEEEGEEVEEELPYAPEDWSLEQRRPTLPVSTLVAREQGLEGFKFPAGTPPRSPEHRAAMETTATSPLAPASVHEIALSPMTPPAAFLAKEYRSEGVATSPMKPPCDDKGVGMTPREEPQWGVHDDVWNKALQQIEEEDQPRHRSLFERRNSKAPTPLNLLPALVESSSGMSQPRATTPKRAVATTAVSPIRVPQPTSPLSQTVASELSSTVLSGGPGTPTLTLTKPMEAVTEKKPPKSRPRSATSPLTKKKAATPKAAPLSPARARSPQAAPLSPVHPRSPKTVPPRLSGSPARDTNQPPAQPSRQTGHSPRALPLSPTTSPQRKPLSPKAPPLSPGSSSGAKAKPRPAPLTLGRTLSPAPGDEPCHSTPKVRTLSPAPGKQPATPKGHARTLSPRPDVSPRAATPKGRTLSPAFGHHPQPATPKVRTLSPAPGGTPKASTPKPRTLTPAFGAPVCPKSPSASSNASSQALKFRTLSPAPGRPASTPKARTLSPAVGALHRPSTPKARTLSPSAFDESHRPATPQARTLSPAVGALHRPSTPKARTLSPSAFDESRRPATPQVRTTLTPAFGDRLQPATPRVRTLSPAPGEQRKPGTPKVRTLTPAMGALKSPVTPKGRTLSPLVKPSTPKGRTLSPAAPHLRTSPKPRSLSPAALREPRSPQQPLGSPAPLVLDPGSPFSSQSFPAKSPVKKKTAVHSRATSPLKVPPAVSPRSPDSLQLEGFSDVKSAASSFRDPERARRVQEMQAALREEIAMLKEKEGRLVETEHELVALEHRHQELSAEYEAAQESLKSLPGLRQAAQKVLEVVYLGGDTRTPWESSPVDQLRDDQLVSAVSAAVKSITATQEAVCESAISLTSSMGNMVNTVAERLAFAEARVHRTSERVACLSDVVEERDALAVEIKALEESLVRSQENLSDLHNKLMAEQDQKMQLEFEAQKLSAEVENLRQANARLTGELRERRVEVEEARNKVVECELSINELTEKARRAEEEARHRQQKMEDQKKEFRSLIEKANAADVSLWSMNVEGKLRQLGTTISSSFASLRDFAEESGWGREGCLTLGLSPPFVDNMAMCAARCHEVMQEVHALARQAAYVERARGDVRISPRRTPSPPPTTDCPHTAMAKYEAATVELMVNRLDGLCQTLKQHRDQHTLSMKNMMARLVQFEKTFSHQLKVLAEECRVQGSADLSIPSISAVDLSGQRSHTPSPLPGMLSGYLSSYDRPASPTPSLAGTLPADGRRSPAVAHHPLRGHSTAI